jgi:hypothetical protein
MNTERSFDHFDPKVGAWGQAWINETEILREQRLAREAATKAVRSCPSREQLQSLLATAIEEGDSLTINAVLDEARSRDRWDDTDPFFAHLVLQVEEGLERMKDGTE